MPSAGSAVSPTTTRPGCIPRRWTTARFPASPPIAGRCTASSPGTTRMDGPGHPSSPCTACSTRWFPTARKRPTRRKRRRRARKTCSPRCRANRWRPPTGTAISGRPRCCRRSRRSCPGSGSRRWRRVETGSGRTLDEPGRGGRRCYTSARSRPPPGASMSRRALPATAVTLACLAALAGPRALAAQALPPYASMNPMVFSRTGLATQPYVAPGRRWRVGVLLDYASPIEYTSTPQVFYVMDAELLRLQLTVTREVGKNAFLLAEGSFNAAYDGFLDGFLQWYHNLVGLQVAARKIRPRNSFDYELDLADGRHFTYTKSSGYLGDLRLGLGARHSRHWQTVASV